MGTMFDDLKTTILYAIEECNTLEIVETMYYNLAVFCQKNHIEITGNKISNEILHKTLKLIWIMIFLVRMAMMKK